MLISTSDVFTLTKYRSIVVNIDKYKIIHLQWEFGINTIVELETIKASNFHRRHWNQKNTEIL